ncbi:hypothetical protein DEIPH_ctg017orf0099 [Deinococcus phoenicis]|uniref:Uncharacterized protein n=1 Tax=Deinococcus phoenicis TaxID=1476583 RepID=A0A016QRZ0_9DEIO|nr:hypothetical protein [Deinococcus phoenicis]EYB68756.1 hypothetical protein DEIPH_ctg017orf0099 [Deinococcus phoenicis]
MSDDKTPAVPDRPYTETKSDGVPHDDPVYQPPANAEESDLLDAAVDGTSASHYGANDPALYEDTAQDSGGDR